MSHSVGLRRDELPVLPGVLHSHCIDIDHAIWSKWWLPREIKTSLPMRGRYKPTVPFREIVHLCNLTRVGLL